MNCRTHTTRTAVNTCNQCGDWLCDDCTADAGGRIYCRSCLEKYWVQDHTAAPKPPPYYPPRAVREREISFGLLLLFTFLPPGINYMYEGLIKRGLFILSSFFLTWYLAATLQEPIFGFAVPIMWITCAFDAFRIRRRLLCGESVPDSVEDILGFIKKYKTVLIMLLIIVLGLNILNTISNAIYYLPFIQQIRPMFNNRILPVLVLLGGIYLIVLSGKRSKSSTFIDHRHKDKDNKQ